MKKKKLVILSVLLCFVLSGCGSRSGEKVMSLTSIDIPEETSGEPTGSGQLEAAGRQEKDAHLTSESIAGKTADGGEASGGESGTGQGHNNQPDSSSRSEAGDTKGTEAAAEPESTQEPEDNGYDFTMCFAGDINLDENWCTTQFMSAQENGIYDCISEELVTAMQEADIMCLNNEFTYSTGGAPLPNKLYTFRAMPERVEVLRQLGVDVVTLANNHVYDYGPEAMLDTFNVLEEAEIPYFGAGRTLADARKPLYLEIQGKTVSLVGASRAEKYKMTPQATDTEPGILRCYDPELFLETIREAKEHSDFCIAFVHWGKEDSFELEEVMPETGRQYLDAGADAIIGAHPHRLQAMEYYDGKPIIYSLGNYWFNEETLDTMLIRLHFTGDDASSQLTVQVIPAVQAGYKTTYASDAAEQRRIYDFLEGLSPNVSISDEGMVSEVR